MSRGLRTTLRWLHIVLGAVIVGTYLYSTLGEAPAFRALVLWGAFPALGLSGLAMWQWGRIARLLDRGKS